MDDNELLDSFVQDAELLSLFLSAAPASVRREVFDTVPVELLIRFERTGSINDLDQAVRIIRQILSFTPADDPDRNIYLNLLGFALQKRFESMGSLEDLDLSISIKEINGLNEALSNHVQITVIEKPNREGVLSAIADKQIVHFSCHVNISTVDPSQSRLLLHDWQISQLTVSDFMMLNMQFPQLAYLSACHSASSRDLRLLSESINHSSAIQLAGYPSVVGTLWQVGDMHSAEIAEDMYRGMLKGSKLHTERSAECLHEAVCSLRERMRTVPGFKRKVLDDPLVWASFIHLGV